MSGFIPDDDLATIHDCHTGGLFLEVKLIQDSFIPQFILQDGVIFAQGKVSVSFGVELAVCNNAILMEVRVLDQLLSVRVP